MQLVDPILTWHQELTDIRRDLHAHPELGYQETWTSERVARLLEGWGIPIHRGLAGTGVVGIVEGARGTAGGAIGLRADMDALPMQEVNTFAHASRNPGRMHACGHDGHTAMLLGAARYLARHRDFDGIVYLIFQPAEEGGGGAARMIREGLFERFPMQAVFGMHNWPGLPAGHFGLTPGPIMGSSNEFAVKLRGRGAHAAMPHMGADPVIAAVQMAQSLQSIVTRNKDPLDTAVLSVTQIHAGSADNVIPTEAELRGTVRTFALHTLDLIEQRMGEIVRHTAAAFDVQAEFDFHRNYPPTINHPAEAALAADVLRGLVGPERVNDRVAPSLAAEDFAFMLADVPGCYVWLGVGDGEHRVAGHGMGPCTLHNGSYDFNDDMLPVGASYWVRLVEHWFAVGGVQGAGLAAGAQV
ncbi:amidohydrolase [Verticiella sediminum]|uniref:Amidohydrolase n=1 Tax=Verticiella sediminum TaxID=1247510 RepID=A0A556A7K5_9BURK|nr:M20 aminoacylase family protein [Verticiella sediminum]TSH88875.1 amidohydrolase [Verticiella sediminum]